LHLDPSNAPTSSDVYGSHDATLALAAPSCVLPASLAENIRHLHGRIPETALCLFETASCLAYTENDLPRNASSLDMTFHAHLPLDLPWSGHDPSQNAAVTTAALALDVLDRVASLSPRCAVLHPPDGPTEGRRLLLAAFARHWHQRSSVPLLLENTRHCDVLELGEDFRFGEGFGLCLDIAHLMGYGQWGLLVSRLPESAGIVHWSAPGVRDDHRPLAALTPPQREVASALIRRVPPTATHLLEIFDWDAVAASIPYLQELARRQPPSVEGKEHRC
jgi:hypothetical protein